LDLALVDPPQVVHAPDDPYSDVHGFVALPGLLVVVPEPAPEGWARWCKLDIGLAGDA
jgi:hypothetical protein